MNFGYNFDAWASATCAKWKEVGQVIREIARSPGTTLVIDIERLEDNASRANKQVVF